MEKPYRRSYRGFARCKAADGIRMLLMKFKAKDRRIVGLLHTVPERAPNINLGVTRMPRSGVDS